MTYMPLSPTKWKSAATPLCSTAARTSSITSGASAKASHPVWLAHFVDETDYEGDYAIWQASAYGHIPGIVGDVDMDILYGLS